MQTTRWLAGFASYTGKLRMQPVPKSVLELTGTDGTTDVTPAAVISYAEIQSHLKLDGGVDQVVVEGMISAVTKRVEEIIERKIITQHWSVYFDFFPFKNAEDDWWEGAKDGHIGQLYTQERGLDLPFGPCQSVSFIKTYDEGGTASTFDASNYVVDSISQVPKIRLKSGTSWPSGTLRPLNGVHVRGVFGFGGTASVPQDIKHAIKLGVSTLYQNRGDDMDAMTISKAVYGLLEHYKRWKLR